MAGKSTAARSNARKAPAAKPAAPRSAPKAAPESAAPEPSIAAPAKAAKPPKAAKTEKAEKPVVKPEKAAKTEKPKKAKLLRDSFTMPEDEYAALGELKKRLLPLGVAAKKSELLRAGIALLSKLDDQALGTAMAAVEVIKTGRPTKNGK